MKAIAWNISKSIFAFAIPVLLWVAANQFVPTYLIPTPVDVIVAVHGIIRTLPFDIAVTFVETIAGLVLAIIFSFLLGLSFYFFSWVEDGLMPYAVALKSVPVVAMAPLLVIWTGNGIAGKITLAAIVSFFPLLIGFRDGLHAKSLELDHVARVWSTSKRRTLLYMDLPLSLPSVMSALKVAAPLSLVGAVVAEFSGANSGLGHLVIVAAYRADVALLFGAVIIVSLFGIALFQGAAFLETVSLKFMRMSRAD
jgi:NitT/TauT family transport system permease protein